MGPTPPDVLLALGGATLVAVTDQLELPIGPAWRRLDRSGLKTAARYLHRSGWIVAHCGHPTAHWPYQLRDPAHPGRLIVSSSGHGFRLLADAKEAVERICAGTHAAAEGPASLRFGRVYRVVPIGELAELEAIRLRLDGEHGELIGARPRREGRPRRCDR